MLEKGKKKLDDCRSKLYDTEKEILSLKERSFKIKKGDQLGDVVEKKEKLKTEIKELEVIVKVTMIMPNILLYM